MKSQCIIIISFIVAFAIDETARAGDFSHLTAFFNNSGGGDYYDSELNKLVWGQEANGVRIALMPGNPLSNNLGIKKEYIGIVVTNITNNRLSFILPEIPLQFDLAVLDEQGVTVSRTESGHDIGKPLPRIETAYAVDKSGHQYDKTRAREFLAPGEFDLFTSVNLSDYFKIEKPGKYRVEYEQRFQIAVLQSNEVSWVGFACPKAIITIDVH
jgi:hypothetical protein